MIQVGASDNPADFRLFHDRVEYLLGLRSEWATIADGNAVTFAYTMNGKSRTKAITRQVFAAPGTVRQ